MRSVGFILLFIMALLASCGDRPSTVEISTQHGVITIELFNNTPKHKENFLKLINEGYYDDLLFHRVMNTFMIQGGDPQSKGAAPNVVLGEGGPGYTLPAEIGAPHFRGALAAARLSDQMNPKKESSGSQFFIVQGQPIDEGMLKSIEHAKQIKYNDVQRKSYLKDGGTPFLDNEYTVFGKVIKGMDVVDKIALLERDQSDRPIQDVKMKIKIIH